MIQFLLLLISIILFLVIAPIGFLFQVIDNFFHLNDYLFKVAISIDQCGNVVCSGLLNHTMITSDGYRFGNEDETISSVLGKNKETKTLTGFGFLIAELLNRIEKNHVENAVGK